ADLEEHAARRTHDPVGLRDPQHGHARLPHNPLPSWRLSAVRQPRLAPPRLALGEKRTGTDSPFAAPVMTRRLTDRSIDDTHRPDAKRFVAAEWLPAQPAETIDDRVSDLVWADHAEIVVSVDKGAEPGDRIPALDWAATHPAGHGWLIGTIGGHRFLAFSNVQ